MRNLYIEERKGVLVVSWVMVLAITAAMWVT